MKKHAEKFIVIGFSATIIVLMVLFFVLPHQPFSELENRYLEKTPQLSAESILSGEFSSKTEDFMTDHFPFRAQWLKVKSTAEALRLQQENNEIYQGREGYLFEKVVEPDWDMLDRSIASINKFAKEHNKVSFTFLLAPTSVGIYEELLPWKAPSYPQGNIHAYLHEGIAEDIDMLDGLEFLQEEKTSEIYYRTDHHWTTYGAYLAYLAYAEKMGWQALAKEEFHIEQVSESFLGSYHTRGQFSGVAPDKMEAYHVKTSAETEVYIADTNEILPSMYDASFLDKKDKYSYFLGGVHALMEIRTLLEQAQVDAEKILVIKDSYAHSFLPFLTNHVADIHVIDLRYYNGSIDAYLAEHKITDVLFLFNTSTVTEQSILLR